MIEYHYECDFELTNENKYTEWLNILATSEHASIESLNYIFCTDARLLEINKEFLSHDEYTDIITFNYGDHKQIAGDIYISKERVWENAGIYNATPEAEMLRVMAHGVLHLLGYNDKTPDEKSTMREKEEEKVIMFHVEH